MLLCMLLHLIQSHSRPPRPRLTSHYKFDQYTTIDRVPIHMDVNPSSLRSQSKSELVTLRPKGWLRRALKGVQMQSKDRRRILSKLPFKNGDNDNDNDADADADRDADNVHITDVIYLPPLVSLSAFDMNMCDGESYAHACIHTYMHAYMHTCIHEYMHT